MTQVHVAALSDPALYAEAMPHEEFARLRREAPIAWVEEVPLWRHSDSGAGHVGGSGYWALTRYEDVMAASRQPDIFSSAVRGAFLPDPKTRDDLERLRQSLINMDAPEHTRLRQLVAAAFAPSAVNRIQASIRAHAGSLVAQAVARHEFDVVSDIAAELPLLVIADLFGMPREDRALMLRWSNNLVGFDDEEYGGGNVTRHKRTYVEAFDYARALAATRRARRGDDLASALLHMEIDGRRLTDEEFCHVWLLLVVAGNESTRHFLSGSIQALLEWPDERATLVASAGLPWTAVDELLRWVSPIIQFRRTTARAVDFGGQSMKEGDKVVLYFASANRDETVFTDPDRLQLQRTPNPHLAFGIGPHTCLGGRLARLETAILLDVLRPHLPYLQLTGPVVRLSSNFMNGIKRMPARFVEH